MLEPASIFATSIVLMFFFLLSDFCWDWTPRRHGFCWNQLFVLLEHAFFCYIGFSFLDLLHVIFATTGVIVGWNHLFVLLQLIIWEVLLPRLFYWIMAVLVDDGGELEPVT